MVSIHSTTANRSRMHYLIPFNGQPVRSCLPVKPVSAISGRGKLVYRKNRLLTLLPQIAHLAVLDVASGKVVAQVDGAGGAVSQEVLYDRYRQDKLSLFLGIDNELVVVDLYL